jgi:HSP20 family molecular chaperone IbpA
VCQPSSCGHRRACFEHYRGWFDTKVNAVARLEEVAVSVLRFDPFGDPFRQMDRLTNQLLSGTGTPMGMPMDVWQADDGFHVSLDLPGVDPSSVDISTERHVLTIAAERRPEY